MERIHRSIEVDRPLSTVYGQWTQFEEFPRFMEGVLEVAQVDEQSLHWVAEVGGKREEWTGEILRQIPDREIAWRQTRGAVNAGLVTFTPLGPDRTRVGLMLLYDPQGLVEKVGDALGFVSRRVEGDLRRFKRFIEGRGEETTGPWRDEIHAGQPDAQPSPPAELPPPQRKTLAPAPSVPGRACRLRGGDAG